MAYHHIFIGIDYSIDMQLIPIPQESLYDLLIENIKSARAVKIAVAFIQISGAEVLKQIAREKDVKIVYGKNLFITDPKAIRILFESRFQVRFFDTLGAHFFHPKLYIIEKNNEILVIIGSSNLSLHAFEQNEELNVCFSSNNNDPHENSIIKAVIDYFENLWSSSSCKPVDEEEISNYEIKFNEVNSNRQRQKLNMMQEFGEDSDAILVDMPEDSESYLDDTNKTYTFKTKKGFRDFTISKKAFHENLDNLILEKRIPKIRDLYIVHRGKSLPLKWVFSKIFKIPSVDFVAYQPIKIFMNNGYRIYARKPYPTHEKVKILLRALD